MAYANNYRLLRGGWATHVDTQFYQGADNGASDQSVSS